MPDDSQILLADGTLVDLASKETATPFAFSAPYADLSQVFFSPNGDFIMIGIDFYDLQTGALLGQLDTSPDYLDVGLSADGMNLVVLTKTGLSSGRSWNKPCQRRLN